MLVTEENFGQAMDWISWHSTLAVDTETDGLQPFHGNKIVGVSVGDAETGWYFPFGHGEGPNLPPSFFDDLMVVLQDITLVMFNGTFDLNFLQMAGMRPLRPSYFEEVQVAAHLHNENDFNKYLGRPAGLKELADKYLGPGSSADEAALREMVAMRFGKAKARTKTWKGLMWNLPAAAVEPYATADAILTMQLRGFFVKKLNTEKMTDLYWEMCAYTLILQQMSFGGVKIDRPLCEQLYQETARDAAHAADDFRRMAGNPDLNLNSSVQMHALFGEASVRADLLKEWSDMEASDDEMLAKKELATALLLFRAADKMHGSYFAKYLPLIDRRGLLHASFNVIGAETGRLSCSNPNLQAIPRDVEKHKVKLLFVPRAEGTLWVEMDLSQAEIRLASFYGREFLMAEHLRLGRDIHTETARLIGCDRSTAKRINFSAIYGIGPHKYSKTYGVSFEESKRNLDAYHATYPGFRRLYSQAERFASQNRMLVLPSGRRRHYTIPMGQLIEQKDQFQVRVMNAQLEYETNKASSNLVQGMVAAIMMKAMIRISNEVPEMRMVLTVHDSLIFETAPDLSVNRRDAVIREAQHIMENPAPDERAFRFTGIPDHPDCPIKVDVKTSAERWGLATEWQPK